MVRKRYTFGIGTLFSVIIVYFIYLYARDQGWVLLKWIAFAYLAVVVGIAALSFLVFLLVSIALLLMFLYARYTSKKFRSRKDESVDVEYEVKE